MVSGRVVSDGDKMRPQAKLGKGGFSLVYNKSIIISQVF